MEIIVSILLLGITIFFAYKAFAEYKKSKSIDYRVLCWVLGIVIFFPIIIFYLDHYNIPSKFGWTSNLNSEAWVGIIIAYGVAIISSVIGAFITIRAVKYSIEEQGKVRISENKKSAIPLLKLEEGEYHYKYKYLQFDFLFTEESKKRPRKDIPDTTKITIKIDNVGMRELYQLYVGDFEATYFGIENNYHSMAPILYKGDSLYINLMFYEMGCYDNDKSKDKFDTMMSPINFNCYYKDCYDNWYYQTLEIDLIHQIASGTPLDKRALNVSIRSFQIISAPTEIKFEDLPWNKGQSVSYHL